MSVCRKPRNALNLVSIAVMYQPREKDNADRSKISLACLSFFSHLVGLKIVNMIEPLKIKDHE